MNPGDLVINEYNDSIGILLEVNVDQKLMKNPFSVPWRYKVMWRNGIIKEHDLGTLRRIVVYNRVDETRRSCKI